MGVDRLLTWWRMVAIDLTGLANWAACHGYGRYVRAFEDGVYIDFTNQ
jgi:hypothetical protein